MYRKTGKAIKRLQEKGKGNYSYQDTKFPGSALQVTFLFRKMPVLKEKCRMTGGSTGVPKEKCRMTRGSTGLPPP